MNLGRLTFILIGVLEFGGTADLAAQNVLTWHNDIARTGQNLSETMLTPNNVNSGNFGKLFTIPVDGKVDAEPLYVSRLEIPRHSPKNVLFVATEHGSAYAFDADSGEQYWHVRLLAPGETPSDDRNCGQITPGIGVTSTPVIDLGIGPHGTQVEGRRGGTTPVHPHSLWKAGLHCLLVRCPPKRLPVVQSHCHRRSVHDRRLHHHIPQIDPQDFEIRFRIKGDNGHQGS